MKIKVDDFITLGKTFDNYNNSLLKKISWCFARNKVLIDPIIKAAMDQIKNTESMKKLYGEIDRMKREKFAEMDENGKPIMVPDMKTPGKYDIKVKDPVSFEKAVIELREKDEWKSAVEDENRIMKLWKDILEEEEEIDLYTISSDVFEKYNEDKNGNPVITQGDQVLFLKLGIIIDEEDRNNVVPIKNKKTGKNKK